MKLQVGRAHPHAVGDPQTTAYSISLGAHAVRFTCYNALPFAPMRGLPPGPVKSINDPGMDCVSRHPPREEKAPFSPGQNLCLFYLRMSLIDGIWGHDHIALCMPAPMGELYT